MAVRRITFLWSLGPLGKTNAATLRELQRLERKDSPEKLAELSAQFNRDAISAETFAQHLHALETGYAEQDARLRGDGRHFLTGDTFTIADIISAIKVLRLSECAYPFATNFPVLAAWYQRVYRRPGFQQGVMSGHRFLYTMFRLKACIEGLCGRSLSKHSRYAA